MKKRSTSARKVLVISVALIVAYAALARYSIYYRIRRAGLAVPDARRDYVVGSGDARTSLVYAALGDSLTSGVGAESFEQSYPYGVAVRLAQQRGARIELRTFSYPGATTGDVIQDLLEPAIACHPDIVTVLVGTNDVHRDVGARSFEQNYRHIVERLTEATSATIYLIGLPDIGSSGLLLPPYKYIFARRARGFSEIIRSLGDERHLTFVDLDGATARSQQTAGYYSRDSFHPSAKGYSLWAEAIGDALARGR